VTAAQYSRGRAERALHNPSPLRPAAILLLVRAADDGLPEGLPIGLGSSLKVLRERNLLDRESREITTLGREVEALVMRGRDREELRRLARVVTDAGERREALETARRSLT
jgi:hypothetical protein